ncbi:hypothetical protein FPOAC2_09479 [Fusarium poae]|uniref:Uncharacterized protein n=1 Tax=Fusarium poae TaxID=36050 RepID=A0A1B8APP2_FUSPO|nr:hypothetical protein FPOAC1_009540 [Fusarium poae]KAG8670137.1 hypothetical protein FPOAC1_009540 [Fusarium poae]OBS22336.1 hypothetical protein FPOA_08673 [Fusarium poae]
MHVLRMSSRVGHVASLIYNHHPSSDHSNKPHIELFHCQRSEFLVRAGTIVEIPVPPCNWSFNVLHKIQAFGLLFASVCLSRDLYTARLSLFGFYSSSMPQRPSVLSSHTHHQCHPDDVISKDSLIGSRLRQGKRTLGGP